MHHVDRNMAFLPSRRGGIAGRAPRDDNVLPAPHTRLLETAYFVPRPACPDGLLFSDPSPLPVLMIQQVVDESRTQRDLRKPSGYKRNVLILLLLAREENVALQWRTGLIDVLRAGCTEY